MKKKIVLLNIIGEMKKKRREMNKRRRKMKKRSLKTKKS